MTIPAGWQIDIGLEIHAQLNTQSKIFSGASTLFGQSPNSQACAIDLGMPGVLPSVNAEVFKKAVQFGLSIGAMINQESRFDRKNYFYPDLPKGYQITQMDHPIVLGGEITIQTSNGTEKIIRVTRAHLEEDAGKSIHDFKPGYTGIDLNRAGTPLLEIVSEPDIKNAEEAVAYAKAIHQLLTYLEVCDGNMAEGSLRFDANISVRRQDAEALGTRSEIKNLNSFRFLEQAIHFETERQISVLEAGGTLIQDTRLFDPDRHETRSMRSKETATDYRYFPEPDLLPVMLTAEFIEEIQAQLPELSGKRAQRYQTTHELSASDAALLSQDRRLGDYFDEVLTFSGNAKSAANWVRGDLLSKLNEHELGITACPISPKHLGEMIQLIDQGVISGKIAKAVFAALWSKQTESAGDYVQKNQLEQVSDASAIEPLIDALIAE
ncbi:MAG: Asp-tRNA(Asn)/Glu-tRNA(Gln) amidotransferase subunit GatB, partial [Gammaproteobacteria bacterium]|nr:Asp-tRNA(Asn)/Glu-tRNA(Gln) amidotransferase subunit GatB [Gammaproteobacteria bacterium]